MFKFTSFILLIFTCSDYLLAQDWTEDTLILKGNVKSLHYNSLSNLQAPKEYWDTLDQHYEYNEHGFLVRYNISSSYFGKNANTKFRIYDETGTRCLIEYQLQDGDTASRYEYYYKENGTVDKAILYRWGKYIRTFNYVQDERGLLVEYSVKIPEAGYTSYHYYAYDSARRKIAESETHPTTKEIWSWKYNEAGYLVEEQLIDSNWASSTTVKVNKKGKYKKGKTEDYSKKPNTADSYTRKFNHNEKGQVIFEKKLDGNGEPVSEWTYTYNEQGDVATLIFKNYEKDKTSERSFTYTYDEQGNWITKTSLNSGSVYEEEKRTFVYF